MLRILLLSFTLIFSSVCFSGTEGIPDPASMTEQQFSAYKQILAIEAEKGSKDLSHVAPEKALNVVAETIKTTKVSEWSLLAGNAADAIIEFTTKLGVAASEFLSSTTGVLLVVLGFFYLFGAPVFGVIIGVAFIYGGHKIAYRLTHNVELKDKVTIKTKKEETTTVTEPVRVYVSRIQGIKDDGSAVTGHLLLTLLLLTPGFLTVVCSL